MMKQAFAHTQPDLTLRDAEVSLTHPLVNGGTAHHPTLSLRRQRLTVFLPAPLLERLRNAVYWTRQRPLAQIISGAIEEAVLKMEEANEGEFPPRRGPLKAGRPRRAKSSTPARPSRSLPVEHP